MFVEKNYLPTAGASAADQKRSVARNGWERSQNVGKLFGGMTFRQSPNDCVASTGGLEITSERGLRGNDWRYLLASCKLHVDGINSLCINEKWRVRNAGSQQLRSGQFGSSYQRNLMARACCGAKSHLEGHIWSL